MPKRIWENLGCFNGRRRDKKNRKVLFVVLTNFNNNNAKKSRNTRHNCDGGDDDAEGGNRVTVTLKSSCWENESHLQYAQHVPKTKSRFEHQQRISHWKVHVNVSESSHKGADCICSESFRKHQNYKFGLIRNVWNIKFMSFEKILFTTCKTPNL